MPENVFTVEELDKYKNLEDQEVLVNPVIVHLTVEERKKRYRDKYHETGELDKTDPCRRISIF